ncbi:MAG TPA: sugar porter family MFS transporter [Bryobacteraceae bacterium]|nr:sugar porter family MFS transporter [Bryobacteraceae bacterium]
MNAYLVRSSIVAALGGLLFGFDTAVISGVTSALKIQYSLTPLTVGFTVSAALVGTILGALFGGIPGDRYGRRASLRITGILYLLSALGCAFAFDWSSLVVARFVGGLGIGASSVLGPMYIAEIAPPASRGKMVGLFQFNIVFGILLAYFSNYVVGSMGFGEAEWRWKLGVAAIPAAIFCLALFGIPESPRWLAQKGRTGEAEDVLRGTGDPDYRKDLAEIVASVQSHQSAGAKTGASEPLFQSRYRFPIFLAVSIGMFNQLSGINAILYYLNDIFAAAGFTKVSGDLQSVAVGATNLLFTVVAMSVIDRLGRKKLLLIGAAGTSLALAGVAAIFLSGSHQDWLVWCLVAFIGFFAFSQGAVIWVYLSEVFPTLVRARGQSLGSFTHWVMNALISFTFPSLAAVSRGAPFVFFALMTVVQFFVVLAVYPETKGYTLEEMQSHMTAG